MKKGVKHIEEHFSVEWKKERVGGKMRGGEEGRAEAMEVVKR